MKQLFREFFTYTNRERNGVLALLSVIGLLLAFLAVYRLFFPSEAIDFTAFEKEVEALYAQKETREIASPKNGSPATRSRDVIIVEHFLFDPNTATATDFERLGLSPKQAKAVVNYVAKGGKFRTKEDFKKLRVIPSTLYATLEPYISIAEKERSTEATASSTAPALLDINSADSLALLEVDGIGPVFAYRILRFRDALGGFVNREQLREVRGMTDEKYDLIIQKLLIDPAALKKINLNTCTVEQLSKHPYISYNLARSLVNYRSMHGKYRKTEDIRASDLVNEELYLKIAPYLTVDQ